MEKITAVFPKLIRFTVVDSSNFVDQLSSKTTGLAEGIIPAISTRKKIGATSRTRNTNVAEEEALGFRFRVRRSNPVQTYQNLSRAHSGAFFLSPCVSTVNSKQQVLRFWEFALKSSRVTCAPKLLLSVNLFLSLSSPRASFLRHENNINNTFRVARPKNVIIAFWECEYNKRS